MFDILGLKLLSISKMMLRILCLIKNGNICNGDLKLELYYLIIV